MSHCPGLPLQANLTVLPYFPWETQSGDIANSIFEPEGTTIAVGAAVGSIMASVGGTGVSAAACTAVGSTAAGAESVSGAADPPQATAIPNTKATTNQCGFKHLSPFTIPSSNALGNKIPAKLQPPDEGVKLSAGWRQGFSQCSQTHWP